MHGPFNFHKSVNSYSHSIATFIQYSKSVKYDNVAPHPGPGAGRHYHILQYCLVIYYFRAILDRIYGYFEILYGPKLGHKWPNK